MGKRGYMGIWEHGEEGWVGTMRVEWKHVDGWGGVGRVGD